ncbi:MAG: RdgB/HAM1 family non-canonical purine NTP pyrophosphatase [Neomegalonema sp.]|nr:RdgB/HAM1 family non-canonical purine NTP pyrophosphatase [Neomegalonema sp.]
MSRRLKRGDKIVVATHNAGKLREIRALVEPYGIEAVSAAEFGLAAPEETETTFEGNALIKARAAAQQARLPALADDSGLSVDAIGGAPGVYTADWAETPAGRDFGLAMRRLHSELQAAGAAEPWAARFNSALAVAWPDGEEIVFLGQVEGRISWPPRGDQGFGYDPVFVRAGETETFGEMSADRKQADDHRSDAFAKLSAAILEEETE